jgi:transcription elongation factor GreA
MRVNLTREGFEKLSEELKRLKTVKRREIAMALELARAKGDLSENAEYDAAKDEQAHLERRIAELETSLVNVRIIDGHDIDPNKAFIGAHITLIDQDSQASITYMLVSKEEASLKEKKISVESPIGAAIVGKAVGDEVDVTIPAGKKRYKITKIER